MNKKKEILCEYLKSRKYLELEGSVTNGAAKGKPLSATREKKLNLCAIKRFQTFSGLRPTGRANKLTMKETATRRCGFPDLSASEMSLFAADAAPPRWGTPNITYAFRNFLSPPSVAPTRQAVASAFSVWRAAVPAFNFREVPIDNNPLIVIMFIGGAHGDRDFFGGGDGDLAHAFLPNSPILPGDIHFDIAEKWGSNGLPAFIDLETVALHEIGHSLGLEHSLNPNAVMFGPYRGVRRQLNTEDVIRIRTLYG